MRQVQYKGIGGIVSVHTSIICIVKHHSFLPRVASVDSPGCHALEFTKFARALSFTMDMNLRELLDVRRND